MPAGRLVLRTGCARGPGRSCSRPGEHHRNVHTQSKAALTDEPRTSADDLARHLTVDLTTVGRQSGEPRRVEIWWFRVEGRFVVTGTPGPRDWYANILSNPSVVVHVDGRDIDATAVPLLDPAFRRKVFTQPDTSWYSTMADLEELVDSSPMIELFFD